MLYFWTRPGVHGTVCLFDANTSYFPFGMLLGGRRARSVAEGSLQQLEMAYNKLEDSEREKRAAGILKVYGNRMWR